MGNSRVEDERTKKYNKIKTHQKTFVPNMSRYKLNYVFNKKKRMKWNQEGVEWEENKFKEREMEGRKMGGIINSINKNPIVSCSNAINST